MQATWERFINWFTIDIHSKWSIRSTKLAQHIRLDVVLFKAIGKLYVNEEIALVWTSNFGASEKFTFSLFISINDSCHIDNLAMLEHVPYLFGHLKSMSTLYVVDDTTRRSNGKYWIKPQFGCITKSGGHFRNRYFNFSFIIQMINERSFETVLSRLKCYISIAEMHTEVGRDTIFLLNKQFKRCFCRLSQQTNKKRATKN